MYTLMKSEHALPGSGVKGHQGYVQTKVAQYAVFEDAATACDHANRQHEARHYLMNDSGKEYYANVWID